MPIYKTLIQFVRKQAFQFTGKANAMTIKAPNNKTQQLWDALNALNRHLLDVPDSVFLLVKTTHDELKLRGKVSRNYFSSITPFLCRHNEFMALHKWQDLSFLYKLGKNRNAFKLTLALPALLLDGKTDTATEFLTELSKTPMTDWLNTECVRFSVENVLLQATNKQISLTAAMQFQEAFLNLLDSFKGDWFSRLHDVELITATTALLTSLQHYPSSHRNKVVAATIRHYGLCPVFWQCYSKSNAQASEPELVQAKSHWDAIHLELTANANEPTSKYLPELAVSLAWFQEMNNPEAQFFLREISANYLKNTERVPDAAGSLIINRLCQIEPDDKQRLTTNNIWPTYQPPVFCNNNNLLELISPTERISNLLNSQIRVVSVVRNEIILLPHFLAHYRKIGITTFVFVDNDSTDGTREYLLNQNDVVLYATETEYKHACYGVAWQQAVLGNHCLGKWVVLADADEFLIYPDCENRPLAQFISEIENEGADAVLTFMIDMYPKGNLNNADFRKVNPFQAASWCDGDPLIKWRLGSGQYNNTTNYLSSLRHRLAKPSPPNAFTSQKIALVRYQPWLRFSAGLHNAANIKMAKSFTAFAHFKYHANFQDKVSEEVSRGQHYNNAEDYKRYKELFADEGNNFWNNHSRNYSDSKSWLNSLTVYEGKKR